ncbi:MAG: hypothetical protein MRQ08_04905, partial [Candidatus Midichloria mitochondrii]|nr:hypothetical protein [Candidatus Midichloria mitochondrii]
AVPIPRHSSPAREPQYLHLIVHFYSTHSTMKISYHLVAVYNYQALPTKVCCIHHSIYKLELN